MKMRTFFVLLPMTVLGWTFACSSDKDDDGDATPPVSKIAYCNPADTCPVDVTGVDLTTPVSFKDDVYEPILRPTCNDSTCHGFRSDPRGGLFLGDPANKAASTEMAEVISNLLQPSQMTPDLDIVKPGDWENSFLMVKVDGCQGQMGLSCPEADDNSFCSQECGDGMPQLDSPETGEVYPLTPEQRNTLRAWIAQGAQNN